MMTFSTETLLRNLLTELARYGLQPQGHRQDGDGKLIHLDVGETVIEVEVTSHNPVHYEIGVTRSADPGFCGPAHERYRDISIVARRVAWLELHNHHTELRRVNRFMRQVRMAAGKTYQDLAAPPGPSDHGLSAERIKHIESGKNPGMTLLHLHLLAWGVRRVEMVHLFPIPDHKSEALWACQMRQPSEKPWEVHRGGVSIHMYQGRKREGIFCPGELKHTTVWMAQQYAHAAGFGLQISIGQHVLLDEQLMPFKV